jgi:hypothetical protein
MKSCSVCRHARVAEINAALLAPGVSLRSVSGRFLVARTTLSRHAQAHLRETVAVTPAVPIATPLDGLLLPTLPVTATAREHLARNIRQLDTAADAALVRNELPAYASLVRTKWFVLEKAGMLTDLDGALPTSPSMPINGDDDGIAGANNLRELMAGFLISTRDMRQRLENGEPVEIDGDEPTEILQPVASPPARSRHRTHRAEDGSHG